MTKPLRTTTVCFGKYAVPKELCTLIRLYREGAPVQELREHLDLVYKCLVNEVILPGI